MPTDEEIDGEPVERMPSSGVLSRSPMDEIVEFEFDLDVGDTVSYSTGVGTWATCARRGDGLNMVGWKKGEEGRYRIKILSPKEGSEEVFDEYGVLDIDQSDAAKEAHLKLREREIEKACKQIAAGDFEDLTEYGENQ